MAAVELARLVPRHLAGCLLILIFQIGTLAAFVGIGAQARRTFGGRIGSAHEVFLSAWVGWMCTLALLVVWHFAAPIGGFAWGVVGLLGAAGLFAARGDLRALAVAPPWPLALAVLGFAYWEANLSLASDSAWDSGLYHVQAVKWAGALPVVPGLANLHEAQGFNNSGLLLFAMLDSGFWENRANHLGNGMAVLLLGAQALVGLAALRRGDEVAAAAYDALLLVPVVRLATGPGISSFITDTAPSAALLALGGVVFRRLLAREAAPPGERRASHLSCLALAAGAVTMRENLGFYAAFLAVLVTVLEFRAAPAREAFRSLGLGAALVAAFAIPWMLRGIVLSGYPLFPFPLALPVDWAVPRDHAIGAYAYIAFTEREFAWTYAPRWVMHLVLDPFSVVVPSAIAAAALALVVRSLRRGADATLRPLWLALPIVAALGIWFLTAPSLRYAFALFWTFAAVACGTWAAGSAARRAPRWAIALLVAVAVVAALPGAELHSLRALARSQLVAPGPDLFFHPMYARPILHPYRTRSGLALNVADHHCWDAPLPCTPNPSPALRLRRPGDLRSGFTVDGKWEMENWPYAGASLDRFRATWHSHFPSARGPTRPES